MRGTIVGIKNVDGVGKNGKPYAFKIACITTPMGEFDVQKGAKGLNVHAVTVPDRLQDVLNASNIGKDIDAEFYFSNGRENIAYAMLAK